MAGYTGSAMYLSWINSAGTAILSGDYRKFDYTPSMDLVDQTAGADTNKTYLTSLKDGRASFSGLFQNGANVGGTITASTLVEGASGTIIFGPEGTATGKPKYTIPCISLGAAFSYPYSDNVEISCDFQQNGTRVEGSY
jgi:hypothetical protein